MTMQFRPMQLQDLPAVARLEQAICITPWTLGIFRDCVASGYDGWVLVDDDNGEIVGYAMLSVAAGEAHLLNLGIAAHLRRQGLGRRLAQRMIDLARQLGTQVIFLEVRVSNHIAQALYQSMGFTQIGLRKAYYRDLYACEDALVLALRFDLGG